MKQLQQRFQVESCLSSDSTGEDNDAKLILGDCNEVLKRINSKSIDLIATDPPYQIHYNGFDWDAKDKLHWEELAPKFHRVLKPNGSVVVFQGWSEVFETKQHLDKSFKLMNWIVYDRIKGRGTTRNLVSTREDILWYVADPKNYTYNKIPSSIRKVTGGTIGKRNGCEFRAMSNVWTDISPIVPWSKEKVAHPTQKPLQLMERIIKLFSNEGDVVLDPFVGSGTSLVACKRLGRRGIGIEIDKDFYSIAESRLCYA